MPPGKDYKGLPEVSGDLARATEYLQKAYNLTKRKVHLNNHVTLMMLRELRFHTTSDLEEAFTAIASEPDADDFVQYLRDPTTILGSIAARIEFQY